MIAVSVTPDVVECGRATDAVIQLVNPSPTAVVYELVVDIEPDQGLRLDGGDSHIEVDTLGPGETHAHPVTLTGEVAGEGLIALPHVMYVTDDGRPHRPTTPPLAVRIEPTRTSTQPTPTQPTPGPLAERPASARLPSAFISHRRSDSGWLGELLRDRLAVLLSGSRFFLDYDDLAPGDLWRKRIDDELTHARALLAVIGPEWETCSDTSGRPRLGQPDDVVRYEIGTALRRRIVVIPVLHDGARMPRADDLPSDLRMLAEHQAVPVDHGARRHTLYVIATRLRRAGLR